MLYVNYIAVKMNGEKKKKRKCDSYKPPARRLVVRSARSWVAQSRVGWDSALPHSDSSFPKGNRQC